jgi:hypothetical protein
MQESSQTPKNQETGRGQRPTGSGGQQSPEESLENVGAEENAAVEEDGTPVLDEQDLEENDLSVEEAENIQWEPEQGKETDTEEDT